jgi:hypothetical protein
MTKAIVLGSFSQIRYLSRTYIPRVRVEPKRDALVQVVLGILEESGRGSRPEVSRPRHPLSAAMQAKLGGADLPQWQDSNEHSPHLWFSALLFDTSDARVRRILEDHGSPRPS